MKYLCLIIFFIVACESPDGRIHQDAGIAVTEESQLDCMSWFHECNCSYSCTTRAAYNARLGNGEANCEEFCDDESIANFPSESCEEVNGVCQWVEN